MIDVSLPIMKPGENPDAVDLKRGRYNIECTGTLFEWTPNFILESANIPIPLQDEEITLEFIEVIDDRCKMTVNLQHDLIGVIIIVSACLAVTSLFGGFFVDKVDRLIQVNPLIIGGIVAIPLLFGVRSLVK